MKRARNLFDDILAWDNLQKSLWSAAKGKRDRAEVVGFLHDVQQNLLILQQTLRDQTFDFSRYRQFRIRDPKPRMITAPCFESRIAHHAIISVLDPFFERFAIDHSYACRIGKGRNAAILAAQRAAKQSRWYVKLDIRSCFDSIQHEILLKLLCKRFKDPELLKMLSRVVQSFAESVGCGLPIGALTSQHFANFYLGWMDHHIVHELRPKSYVRYMDDFVMWAHMTK
ncbi:MAG: reverse transcriptase/maturase family protein, partial [Planctomycetota bacterium]